MEAQKNKAKAKHKSNPWVGGKVWRTKLFCTLSLLPPQTISKPHKPQHGTTPGMLQVLSKPSCFCLVLLPQSLLVQQQSTGCRLLLVLCLACKLGCWLVVADSASRCVWSKMAEPIKRSNRNLKKN
jgi:hypothetical protein